jgi:hypothetical protein
LRTDTMPAVTGFTISNNNLFDVIVNPPGGVPFLSAPTAVSAPQNGTGQYNIQPLGGAALFQINLNGRCLNINPQASDAVAFIVTTQLRLQPFSNRIGARGQIYSYGWINSITIYIRLINSIYMVIFLHCLHASDVFPSVASCQITRSVSIPW